MLLRVIQGIVRALPGPARAVWALLPEAARRTVGRFAHPIAVGARGGASVLAPTAGAAPRHYDVVLGAGVPRNLAGDGGAALRERGHRVLAVRDGETLRELCAREHVVDAVFVAAPGDAEEAALAARLGLRRADPAALSSPPLLEAAFPEVTIVIVAHAPADVCGACLAAVRRNTPWPRLRIVVVDNGTGPATRAVLDAAASADPRVVVLTNATNQGFARAANQGIASTRSDIVVFLNDDTAVGPGWLPRLVAHLESEPRIGLVCPTTNEIGNAAKLSTSYASFPEMEAFAAERSAAHAGERRSIASIALFCAAARRETLAEVGFLDERFEIGMFEDDDLSRSLRLRGYELCVALDSFVHHVGQASFSRLTDARYLEVWKANRRKFEEKWGVRWAAPEK